MEKDTLMVGSIWKNNSTGVVQTIVSFDPRTGLYWFANSNRPVGTAKQITDYYSSYDEAIFEASVESVKKVVYAENKRPVVKQVTAKKKVGRKKATPNVAKADKAAT